MADLSPHQADKIPKWLDNFSLRERLFVYEAFLLGISIGVKVDPTLGSQIAVKNREVMAISDRNLHVSREITQKCALLRELIAEIKSS